MGEKTVATYQAKIAFTIKRFKDFLSIFTRNKRGVLGVLILVFFGVTALLAPLMTSYDPVHDNYLAGDYAVPIWLKYVLGTDRAESQNYLMLPEKEVGFPTSASLLQEWNFTSPSTHVSLQYDPTFGNKKAGSGIVTFTREAGKFSGEVTKARLTRQFHYPFSGPPTRFSCQISFLAEGVEDIQQLEIVSFIKRVENISAYTSYPLWNTKIYKSTPEWKMPHPAIDSYHSSLKERFGNITSDPARIVFSNSVDYIFDVELRFTDSPLTVGPVQVTVYLDDLNIKFYGSAFGLLGTDQRGRDIFSQLVYGARISLLVGLLSAFLSVTIGLALGLISGYLGKIVDEIMMRFTDMLLVLPSLPLLIVLIAVLGPSLWNLILLIGVLGWMGFARMVRSQVLSLRERPFIEAAKAVGAGKFHIILKHILPNVMSLVYVTLAMSVPSAILSEAALSWLGLFDPRVMSWGRMLHDAQFEQGIDKLWWIGPPGICIAVVSISFILLGYALDEILNPKLRKRR